MRNWEFSYILRNYPKSLSYGSYFCSCVFSYIIFNFVKISNLPWLCSLYAYNSQCLDQEKIEDGDGCHFGNVADETLGFSAYETWAVRYVFRAESTKYNVCHNVEIYLKFFGWMFFMLVKLKVRRPMFWNYKRYNFATNSRHRPSSMKKVIIDQNLEHWRLRNFFESIRADISHVLHRRV